MIMTDLLHEVLILQVTKTENITSVAALYHDDGWSIKYAVFLLGANLPWTLLPQEAKF